MAKMMDAFFQPNHNIYMVLETKLSQIEQPIHLAIC